MLFVLFACTATKLAPEALEEGSAVQHAKEAVKEVSKIPFFEVKGRQGVAAMGDKYYVSGSTALYVYDKEGQLLLSNEDPFKQYKIPSNHIGDIEAYNGELYIAAEWFSDGVGKDIQIAIHDTTTLEWKRSFPFQADSGQLEVSGITVDPERNLVWMCSWVGDESGRHLYSYDLNTGEYKGKLRLSQEIKWIQGVEYYNDHFYISADDGDAEKGEADNIYRVTLAGEVSLYRNLKELNDVGEAEGLSVDVEEGVLLVHANRGKRIVKGMSRGFYEGYDREIREVYKFPMP